MRTITFYAYKGGTGRTMAVANAARFLARGGTAPFVLDFDLEAPGLPYKFGLRRPGETARRLKGLVDFLTDARARFKEPHKTAPLDFKQYVQELGDGLQFMPAGNAPSARYSTDLANLDLPAIFTGGSAGTASAVPLFQALKNLIEATYDPRYLLIDSRTGATDIGGAALHLMPNVVVCLVLNNEESRWGAREILQTVKAPTEIVLVVSRVPEMPADEETRLLDDTRQFFNEAEPPADWTLGPTDVFVLHSEPALERFEEIRVDSDTTPNESILLRDYWKLFHRLGLDEVRPRPERDVIAQLATQPRARLSPLVGGPPPPNPFGPADSVKTRVRQRRSLNSVPPVYLHSDTAYSDFVERVRKQLLGLAELPPDGEDGAVRREFVHFDLLAEHIRDGVLDFFGDPFYLTPNRAHLVDIVQFGWSKTYTAFGDEESSTAKKLRKRGREMDLLDCKPDFLACRTAVGVLGDTPAASEANRRLSRYLRSGKLISKGSERDLIEWLDRVEAEHPEKIVICDLVTADKLQEVAADPGARRIGIHKNLSKLSISFHFEHWVPSGFVFPREDLEWRRLLARATAYGLWQLIEEQLPKDGTAGEDITGLLVDDQAFLRWDELRVNLLFDMTLKDAAVWNPMMMATLDRVRRVSDQADGDSRPGAGAAT